MSLDRIRIAGAHNRENIMAAALVGLNALWGLGCSRGCDFCCTSHFFDRKHVALLKSGRDLHEAMRACAMSR